MQTTEDHTATLALRGRRLSLPTGAKLQEYALVGVIIAACRRRIDPQARHVPHRRQLPGDPHAVERRRRAGDRHDIRDRHGRHRSVGRIDRGRRRRRRRVCGSIRESRCSSSARSGSRCCSERSTPSRSPTARSCRSSPRWRCWRSPAASALKMSDKKPISLLDSKGVRWFGTGKILGQPVSIVIFVAA